MTTTLAAGTGATILGGLGTGGLAFALFTALILGTRSKGAKVTFKQGVALFLGLATGTVLIAAAGIWGLPDDLTRGAMDAAKIGSGGGPLGDVQPGAVAIVLVLVAYMVNLKPRTAGVTGLAMASVFATAGGAWAMIATSIGAFFLGLAT